MTSKHHHQLSRRYPLKRVRLDNENQGFLTSSNGRINKKFCSQSSEDSAFVDTEKSSDERAFDLFHKEYFLQFRPYFKHYSITIQFIEHLWLNMIESSKLSFVKKKLKEHGIYDLSLKSYNDTDTLSNDENDSQISRSLNESNKNTPILNGSHKYSRGFINDLLSYLKHWITPRFIEKSSSKKSAPLRRSSRIRRAPVKCVCSTCVTTLTNDEHSSSTSITDNDREEIIYRQLIDHYHQLDDQYLNSPNSFVLTNNVNHVKLNQTNDNEIEMPVSEVIDSLANVRSSSITPVIPMTSDNIVLPTVTSSPLDLSIDSNKNLNEKIQSDSLTTPELQARRTYVILTELDEPFFGPYSIEFTITI